MNRAVIISFLILFAGIIWLRETQWQKDWGKGVPEGSRLRLTSPLEITISKCIMNQMGWEVVVPRKVCSESALDKVQVGDLVVFLSSCKPQVILQKSYKKYSCITQNIRPVFLDQPSILSWWRWQRKLLLLREKILSIVQSTVSEPEASLIAGIVLGEQGNLPADFYQALQVTGTMHIVVASGYNVAVVIGIGLGIGIRLFGRRGGLIVAIVSIAFYVLLAGTSPPLLRACLMGMVMMVGVYFGREYWSFYSLGIVSGVLLLWQPWLLHSLSFQLSVAATAGVIGGVKPVMVVLRKMFGNVKGFVTTHIFEALATTIAASIATWPLTVLEFGEVSVWGLVVNPMILWLIPLLMYLGSMLMILGIVWAPLALVLSWLVNPMATLFVEVIRLVGSRVELVPLSINWFMAIGWWLVWIGIVYGATKHG